MQSIILTGCKLKITTEKSNDFLFLSRGHKEVIETSFKEAELLKIPPDSQYFTCEKEN